MKHKDKKCQPNTPLEFVQKIDENCVDHKTVQNEFMCVDRNGNEIWYEEKVMPLLNNDTKTMENVLVRHDISEKKQYEKMSITDPLTQLYNRRYFNKILTCEIGRARRNETLLALMMIDVDHFKKYNDSYGHQAGDEVLVSIAKSLQESSKRASDFVFRLGGEEFAILFSPDCEKNAIEFAEKIKNTIYDLQIPHANSDTSKYITVSIGLLIIDFANEMVDEDGFYTMADDALYQAKNEGRNRVVLYQNEELDFF